LQERQLEAQREAALESQGEQARQRAAIDDRTPTDPDRRYQQQQRARQIEEDYNTVLAQNERLLDENAYQKALVNTKDAENLRSLLQQVKERETVRQQEVNENIKLRLERDRQAQMAADVETERTTQRISEARMEAARREADLTAQEQIAQSAANREMLAEREAEIRKTGEGLAAGQMDRVVGETPIERPKMPTTRSEKMLIELLDDHFEGRDGFVGREPITLPMVMMRDNASGVEAVVVDKFNGGQGILRGGKGIVSRSELREPRGELETRTARAIGLRDNVLPTPTREQAIDILQNRIKAEQNARLADAHRTRPDFSTNTAIQSTEFNLRKEAVNRLLEATNRQFGEGTSRAIDEMGVLEGKTILSSLKGVEPKEAMDVAMALKGAGFENVRLSMNTEGKIDISLTRGISEAENEAAGLFMRRSYRKGILDPHERSYEGLSQIEQEKLGRAEGFSEKQIEKYNKFIDQTLTDMSSRGIRVNATTQALGIAPLEEQAASRALRAQELPPEAVVSAAKLERFEIGDIIKMNGKNFQVFAEAQVNGERNLLLEGIDKSNFGLQLAPISEEHMRLGGVTRQPTKPIGREPNWKGSPARDLEGLLNPENIPAPPPPVAMTANAISAAARAEGMSASVGRSGDITITHQGTKFVFEHPEDAARFVENVRYLKEERMKIIKQIGGSECL
jgi:hypothetical protein